MTTTFTGGEVYGFRPGNSSRYFTDADYTIPPDDVLDVDITERVTDYKDSAKLLVNNTGGAYSGVIDHGDRLLFTAGEVMDGEAYGEGPYGEGPYGSSKVIRWTGMVRPFNIEGKGADVYDLEITAEDFVASIMGSRRVYATFEDRKIVGSNGLVNEIIRENAPEVNPVPLPDLPDTTTMFINGDYLLDVVAEAARRCNCVMRTFQKSVTFVQAQEIAPEFELEPGDYSTFNYKSNDDNLYNEVRVEGGTGIDIEEQAQQTTVDDFERVTDTNRILYQIDTRKSELDRVEIYTRKVDNDDNLVARLQKDDGGAPIAVESNRSDIAKRNLAPEFISGDDYTTFIFPDHTLPEPQPWLIIESEGSAGQDVGINSATGDPGVIPWYPYDIISVTQDGTSVDNYRLREEKITDDSLGTFSAARDLGNSVLESNSYPVQTLSAEAEVHPTEGARMFTVEPGDVVTVNRPVLDVNEDFVITEVVDNYHSSTLTRNFTLRDLESL